MKKAETVISHIYHDDNKNQPVKPQDNPDYSEEGWHIQTNEDHCEGVAKLAAEFAAEFDMASWGSMLGYLHDRGKESEGFQAYIRRTSGFDPSAYSSQSHFHSNIGSVIAHQIPYDRFYWLSNPIAGHHSGLYNIDELELDLSNPLPNDVSKEIPDISLSLPKFKLLKEETSHLSRMLFSCLVDADWLDTESFMQPEKAAVRGNFSTLEELQEKLQSYRDSLATLPSSPLNKLRNEIQQRCEKAASLEPGFFELTVPTGGGKTIASMIWALKHAIKFNKKRIIIALPFTSIITQTAATLKNIFGENNVIEHHSALNEEVTDDKSLLACENWDAPIIVTTNVQLFESMFSNRRSSCRKLHSVVNSVIILDEVQALPLSFLQPIINGMKTYSKIFGTSFLFCTASQPILDGKRKGCNEAIFDGIEKKQIRSIINTDLKLHEQLRRVKIIIEDGKYSYSSLAEELKKHKRVLCIVSSRRHAKELYKELINIDDSTPIFHLSRSMCSSHILKTIEEIKNILADTDKGIRVISTQLIEAGVDIDFPVVYRQLTGLDSVLQAAGRCNREGKLEEGTTFVFAFQEGREMGTLRIATDTMKDMISVFPEADWFSPDVMRQYYERLYFKTPYFDKEKIEELLKNPETCQFEEASKRFSLINENGINIIANFGEAEKLIKRLKYVGPSRRLSRQLGRYSVNVPERTFKEFYKAGLIEEPLPGFYYIPLKSQYDSSIGLKSENDYLDQYLII